VSPREEKEREMPLLQILLVLVVIGVLLWLVNSFIPMQGTIKSILNAVVVICTVLWLLNISLLLRTHLLPRFRDSRLCDITRAEVQQFITGKLKDGYAWETTHHFRTLLSKIMSTAVSRNYLSDNPVRGVKMPERTLKRPHRFLTMDEVRRLIAASEEPVRTIVMLATLAGLRIGEILALRWGGINLAAGTLRVEETCYHGRFGTPKTKASRRELPLPAAVVQALLTHRPRSSDVSDEALVFCTSNGTPLASNNLRKRQLRPACLRAGLAPINWHTLRHTEPFCTSRERLCTSHKLSLGIRT
jgi:integrase